MSSLSRLFGPAAMIAAMLASATPAHAQRGTVPVNVTSAPAGATVFLDSATSPALGTTPMRRVRIQRGTHTLIFKKEGYAEARLPVTVRRRNVTFNVAMEAQSVLDIRAGSERANGATVQIDGAMAGALPVEQVVTPGRHMVTVSQTGFVSFNQWVEVSGGQRLTLPIILQVAAPETGSVLVASDVSGATVTIDDSPRGTTPTVVEGLRAGRHRVRVASSEAGFTPFDEVILIEVGQRSVVNATLRPAPPAGGSVRVVVNVASAIVSVDGQAIGNSPATLADLPPGDHIVEATADGYQDLQQPFSVEAGQRAVVALRLVETVRLPGVIVIQANVDGAQVSVDGEDRGAPPVVIEGGRAGTHAIVVSAPNHAAFRTTCTTAPGQDCRVNADMSAAPVAVTVRANIEGAAFFVDGNEVGPVPFEGEVAGGSHSVEVRAEGYVTFREQLTLRAPREIDAFLRAEGELTEEERETEAVTRATRHRQAVARSGAPLDDDYAIADFSLGWPYIFEGRLGIGILPWLEAGVAVRTFVRLTEFEIRAKLGYRIAPQFSAGLQITGGGGIGRTRDATELEATEAVTSGMPAPTHPSNTAFTTISALATLHFNRAGNFTLWGTLALTSDRWDWSGGDSDCRFVDCAAGGERIDGRQLTARFHLGGSFEFIVARNWNIWTSFEAAFGPERRVLGDVFGAGNTDIQIYPRIGLTYKFDYGS